PATGRDPERSRQRCRQQCRLKTARCWVPGFLHDRRSPMRPWFKAWWTTFRFRQALLEMLVALSLAFLIWLYAHSRAQDSIDRVQVPVQIQLAPQHRDLFLVETGTSPQVTVSFSGPSSRIRELRRKLQRGLVQ